MIREIVDRLEGPLTPFRTDAGAGNEEHETTDVRPRLPR
jgi:hypothetical protein